MKLLYVNPRGQVRRGHLSTESSASSHGKTVLISGGEVLSPGEVLALLAPAKPTEDQRAMLWRAIEAGYRVEDA